MTFQGISEYNNCANIVLIPPRPDGPDQGLAYQYLSEAVLDYRTDSSNLLIYVIYIFQLGMI